jgi:hypothetical protein
METNRFESPVINNLRVVGSLDYNGKITRQHRCWATFRKDESTATKYDGSTGSRMMLAPARLFDYATSESSLPRPFAPPTNARIVSFTVAGKTPADLNILANLNSANFATIGTNSTYSLGIQRCPLSNVSGVDDKGSRDTTLAWPVRSYTPVVNPAPAAALQSQALVDANGRISAKTVDITAGTAENPYAWYYQFLSPIVQPAIAPFNKHIGVLYEGADAAFKSSGGSAVRFAWDAPPSVGATTIATTNPGLALVLVLSTNRTTATVTAAGTNDHLTTALASDLTLEVTIEVEIDKNNDSQNPQAFASGAWSAADLQNVLE